MDKIKILFTIECAAEIRRLDESVIVLMYCLFHLNSKPIYAFSGLTHDSNSYWRSYYFTISVVILNSLNSVAYVWKKQTSCSELFDLFQKQARMWLL